MVLNAHVQAQTQAKGDLSIGLAGDIMLGRLVNQVITQKKDYNYPWGDVLPLLKDHDLNLINLETTLTDSTQTVPKVFNFKATPDKVACLTGANIHVVTIANNHILDFSVSGLLETLDVLDKAAIARVGAGRTLEEARKPIILSRRGVRVGIIGMTDNEPSWLARDELPGTNYISVGDLKSLEAQILAARKDSDILILSIHWGPNMRERPTKGFQEFARKAIDLGVDIFHGHSAHIFQGLEIYKNKLILYDTGDFVDDYYVTPALRNDRSFLFRVTVRGKQLKDVTLFPVLISESQVNLAKGEDFRWTVERMKSLSEGWGTSFTDIKEGLLLNLSKPRKSPPPR